MPIRRLGSFCFAIESHVASANTVNLSGLALAWIYHDLSVTAIAHPLRLQVQPPVHDEARNMNFNDRVFHQKYGNAGQI